MKLFQRITIQDIMNLENISKNTASKEYQEIKKAFKIAFPKMVHYLKHNKISTIDLENEANITVTLI